MSDLRTALARLLDVVDRCEPNHPKAVCDAEYDEARALARQALKGADDAAPHIPPDVDHLTGMLLGILADRLPRLPGTTELRFCAVAYRNERYVALHALPEVGQEVRPPIYSGTSGLEALRKLDKLIALHEPAGAALQAAE